VISFIWGGLSFMFVGRRPAKKFNGSVIPTNKAVPLNGKHETNNLCALCGSAVNIYISFKIQILI